MGSHPLGKPPSWQHSGPPAGQPLGQPLGQPPGQPPGKPLGATSFFTCVFYLFIGNHGSHALAGGILTITEEFGVAEPEEDE